MEGTDADLGGTPVSADAPEWVPVDDPLVSFEELARLVTHRPRASLALGQLLRQTPQLSTAQVLAAEAYSMLLGGTEFASWLTDRITPRASWEDGPLVRVRRENDRLSLLLDHAHRRNAFSFRMREELLEALEVALLGGTVGRIELARAGPVFCSGGDLAEFGTATDLVAAYLVRLEQAPWRLIDRMRDRVMVRVQGARN
ncbi:hypothetical protein [Streptomyces sp. NPDC002172]